MPEATRDIHDSQAIDAGVDALMSDLESVRPEDGPALAPITPPPLPPSTEASLPPRPDTVSPLVARHDLARRTERPSFPEP